MCKSGGGATYGASGRRLSAASLAFCLLPLALEACGGVSGVRQAVPSYDAFTSRLVQLSADQNGDGRLDQWTYLDGNRPFRGEADTDGDGRIDRWEYFDRAAALVMVGTSSREDGVEDTWTWSAPVNGENQVARSKTRDRFIDRREFYLGAELVRVEEDTNADGKTDKWERHEAGVIREVAFDTTLDRGTPDRRLVYDSAGRFVEVRSRP